MQRDDELPSGDFAPRARGQFERIIRSLRQRAEQLLRVHKALGYLSAKRCRAHLEVDGRIRQLARPLRRCAHVLRLVRISLAHRELRPERRIPHRDTVLGIQPCEQHAFVALEHVRGSVAAEHRKGVDKERHDRNRAQIRRPHRSAQDVERARRTPTQLLRARRDCRLVRQWNGRVALQKPNEKMVAPVALRPLDRVPQLAASREQSTAILTTAVDVPRLARKLVSVVIVVGSQRRSAVGTTLVVVIAAEAAATPRSRMVHSLASAIGSWAAIISIAAFKQIHPCPKPVHEFREIRDTLKNIGNLGRGRTVGRAKVARFAQIGRAPSIRGQALTATRGEAWNIVGQIRRP